MKKFLSFLLLAAAFALSAAEIKVPVFYQRKGNVKDFQIAKAGYLADKDQYIFALEIKNLPEFFKGDSSIALYWICDGDKNTGRYPGRQGVDLQFNLNLKRNTLQVISWQDDKVRTNLPCSAEEWGLKINGDELFLIVDSKVLANEKIMENSHMQINLYCNGKRADAVWPRISGKGNGSFLTIPGEKATAVGSDDSNVKVPVLFKRRGDVPDFKTMQAGAMMDDGKYIFAFKIKNLQTMLAGKATLGFYWNSDNDKNTGRFPGSQGVDVQLNVNLSARSMKVLYWHSAEGYRVWTAYEDDYLIEAVDDVLYIGLRKPAFEKLPIKSQSAFQAKFGHNRKNDDVVNCKVDYNTKVTDVILPGLKFIRFGALSSTRKKESYAVLIDRGQAAATVWDCGGERFSPSEATPKFSGKSGTMTLKAARGETASFFFAVESAENFDSLDLQPGNLTGKSGNIIAAKDQQIQYADFVANDRGELFTDVLLNKFPGKSVKRQFAVWHVTVPRDADAGTYKGELALTIGGKKDKSIPVELTVYNFAIPEVPAMRSAFSIKQSPIAYRFRNREMAEKVYRDVIDMEHRFRMGPRLPAKEPKITLDENGKLHIDWSRFDAEAKMLFNEKKVNALQVPAGQLGSHGLFVRWNSILKKNYKDTHDPEFQSVWKQYVRQYVDHMKEMGFYDKMLFIVWDEPYGLEEPISGAKQARAVAPDLPIGIFIDRYDKELNEHIDIWLVTLQTIAQVVKNAKGKRVWLYNSNGVNNFRIPASDLRSFFFLADRCNIEGFLSSSISDITSCGIKNGVFYNLYPQHCFFYVSDDGEVYDSWRLVLLRQGFNDFDYLALYRKLLKAKGMDVPKWLTDAEPGFDADGMPDFKINRTAQLDALRDRVAKEIEQLTFLFTKKEK